MGKKAECGIMVLLLASAFWLASSVQPVKGATLVIYIRADGSVDPPTPLVKRNGEIYTLTNSIYDVSIIVQRDNIVFDGDGHTLQGTGGAGYGMNLQSRSNVTIINVELKAFQYGIYLFGSSKNFIHQNKMRSNTYGMYSSAGANNNNVSLNEITGNSVGLYISSSHHNNLSRNYLQDNTEAGIELNPSHNNTIYGNTIVHSTSYGIFAVNSADNTISGNNITNGTTYGIGLDKSSNNIVNGNNITANGDSGIYLFYADSNDIYGNIITNSQVGIRFWSSANNNKIRENHVSNNTAYGLYLYAFNYGIVEGNYIEANNITNNNYGLDLGHANFNTIVQNTLKKNACGMYLHSSSNNYINHNNLVNNTQQAYVGGSVNFFWDDDYPSGGNYWSDWKAADLKTGPNQDQVGCDGIGDTPYVLDADNQDRYPLMNPWPSHDVAVSGISFTKNIEESGYSIVICVTVADHGDFAEETNLTVYFNNTVIAPPQVITFSRRGLTTSTFTWNTTGIVEGIYNVTAHVEPVALETDLADNTFTAIPGDVNFDRIVNVVDGAAISSHWTGPPIGPSGYDLNYDIDNDGTIGILDASMISAYWTGPPKGPLAS